MNNTHDDLIETYLDELSVEWHNELTMRAYRGDLRQLRDQELHIDGSVESWRSVSAADLQDVMAAMGERYKASTMRRKITVYNLFFRWAVQRNYLTVDPMTGAALPSTPVKINDEISYDTLKELCTLPDRLVEDGMSTFWLADRDKALFYVLVETGLLNKDVLALKISDYQDGAIIFEGRAMPLPPPAREAIDRYLATSRRYLCYALSGVGLGSEPDWVEQVVNAADNLVKPDDILIPNRAGEKMSRAGLSVILHRYSCLDTLKLPPGITLSAMSIRRSYIVRHLRQGVPINVLAAQLGLLPYCVASYVKNRVLFSPGGPHAPVVAARPSRLPRTA